MGWIDVPDHQQWEIQPLGPGYTIRKVSINSSVHVRDPLLNDDGIGRACRLQKA